MRRSLAPLTRTETLFYANAVKLRLGQLTDDQAMIAETYAWAESQGVVDWTKLANVGAPGLPEAYKNRQQSRP